ncbi:MAG: hypothetical protein R3B09_33845 [Nannocystaceae bacterium]
MSEFKPLITTSRVKGLRPRDLARAASSIKIVGRDPTTWKRLLAALPAAIVKELRPRFWEREEEVVLSALEPVKPGRGHLVSTHVRGYYPTAPSLTYERDDTWTGSPPMLEVWLDGLDTAGIYIVELRVDCRGGALHLAASSADHADYPAGSFGESIDVVLVHPQPAAPWLTGPVMALLRLEPSAGVESWVFHYARIWRAS